MQKTIVLFLLLLGTAAISKSQALQTYVRNTTSCGVYFNLLTGRDCSVPLAATTSQGVYYIAPKSSTWINAAGSDGFVAVRFFDSYPAPACFSAYIGCLSGMGTTYTATCTPCTNLTGQFQYFTSPSVFNQLDFY